MDLVVGNTSQLSRYFPTDFLKISSRNIPESVFKNSYDVVYLAFGLSVKGLAFEEYDKINVKYTLELIEKFSKISKRVVVYSTCELWSAYNGIISLLTPMDFQEDPYIISKYNILNEVKKLSFDNVIVLYPFNFNSKYRSHHFLFGKVFRSLDSHEKITVGNIDFNRDMCHASWVAQKSVHCIKDEIIGSGRLTNVKNFIKELYIGRGMEFSEYVKETDDFKFIEQTEYYAEQPDVYSYDMMIRDYRYL